MNEDIIIRVEPELEPQELFRRSVLEKAKLGLCMGVVDNQVKITVDNIGLIASLLEVDTNNEVIIDLIRDSLINNKEEIEPDEFLKLIFDKVLPSDDVIEDTIREAFSVVDVDGDDVITGADIYQVMLTMGEVVSDEELTRMLRAVDADGDGRTTIEEFRDFILGIEPIPVEVPVAAAEPSQPTQNFNNPPPAHRRRRSLFGYGRMVQKQLEVVSKLKNKTVNGCNDEGTEKSEGSQAEASDASRRSSNSSGVTSDEDYVFANLFGEDITDYVITTPNILTKPDDLSSEKPDKEPMNNADAVIQSLTEETENKQVDVEAEVSAVLKQETLDNSNDKVGDSTHSGKEENLQSVYKKTSPYYGRVRPGVFALNPLPQLPVKSDDDEVLSHSERTGSVQMDDNAQQTTVAFTPKTANLKQLDDFNTDSNNEEDGGNKGDRRNYSTMTDFHGIESLKRVDCLQNRIFKRSNTSSDIPIRRKDDNNNRSVTSPISTVTGSINRVSNEYHHNLEKDNRDVCAVFHNDMKRHPPMRPQTAKPSNRVVGHLHRKFKHTDSVTKMIPSSPELIHSERSPTPETSKVLPLRPQTAKPFIGVHVPSQRTHDELDSSNSNFYNRSATRSSLLKSQQSDCLTETKHANPILLSDAIKNESLYSEVGGRSGFRSIRPLARVLMNLQASARNAHKSFPEVSSFSRLLEEDDTMFIKKVTMPTIKALSETSTAKTKLLNLDFTLDKPIRPKLKRASTLTRLPIDLASRNHVVPRESKTLRM